MYTSSSKRSNYDTPVETCVPSIANVVILAYNEHKRNNKSVFKYIVTH